MKYQKLEITKKQSQLIELYTSMAENGYQTSDDRFVKVAFSDMEIRSFKDEVRLLFNYFKINTLLDYGCGGSNYEMPNFSDGKNAKEYFNLSSVYLYEPARNIDERTKADAVVCFDVLEHIFISDVPRVIHELFSMAEKLLIVNVACYSARALLPNGENAHITVRPPFWWKGVFDCISVDYPEIALQLYCSTGWRNAQPFKLMTSSQWQKQDGFVVPL